MPNEAQPYPPLTESAKQELAQRARAAEREARTSSEPTVGKGAMLLFCQAATPQAVLSLLAEQSLYDAALEQEHFNGAAEFSRAQRAEEALAEIRDYLKDFSDRRGHITDVDIPALIDSVIGVELNDKGEASFRQNPDDNDLPF